jgi:LmbE family N-acetylglucosaminyl deacetylase
MEDSLLSIIGHIVNALTYAGVIFYTILYRKRLRRTTVNSSILLTAIVITGLIFISISVFRVIVELSANVYSPFEDTIDIIAQYSGLAVQSVLLLYLLRSKIIIEPNACPGHILAIGAHPDDIEIAAGAALAKMRDSGYAIAGLVLSYGEQGGDAEIRPHEAEKGAQFLGLEEVEVYHFTDTHMSEEGVELTRAIERAIMREKPDIIFTHSEHDLHQDHKAVFEATLRATRNYPVTILCYESPSITQDFRPTYFVDVCDYVEVKVEAIHQHWNQKSKPYMDADLVRSKLVFRGGQAKLKYAEGFEVARMIAPV